MTAPRNYDPAKRYPLVVNVHGGPAAACNAGWPNVAMAPLAAVGYFVLCPNPRGSYGQGVKFAEANVKDFGGGDLREAGSGGIGAIAHALQVLLGRGIVAREARASSGRPSVENITHGRERGKRVEGRRRSDLPSASITEPQGPSHGCGLR